MEPTPPLRLQHTIQRFFAMESAGGILLLASAVLAVLCANSALAGGYQQFLHTKFTIGFGKEWTISKDMLLWINDGLMAIFFFIVGLEIKRELIEGELSTTRKAILPFFAALGGVAMPAAIFIYFNSGDDLAMRGWAIPMATDIAFALGLLALFGSRLPVSLKVFLTAVAVIDDLIAVLVIALFYTSNISMLSLLISGICLAILIMMNRSGVNKMSFYVVVGIVMWVAVLKSGVHATIAGVVLGFMIPLNVKNPHGHSMLKHTEHALHGWVAYAILPLFAFANAGIDLSGITAKHLQDSLPLGIATGLFFGKQLGIFAASFLLVSLGLARKPEGASWAQFYAVCMMCGIGFTMSLFIGGLAYNSTLLLTETKLGVMLGSLASGICSYVMLHLCLKRGQNVTPCEVVRSSGS